MRLAEEIAARLGLEEAACEKFVVFPGRCACFENVKRVLSLSAFAAEVTLGHAAYRVEGENLCVRSYCGGDLVLAGNIVKVEKLP